MKDLYESRQTRVTVIEIHLKSQQTKCNFNGELVMQELQAMHAEFVAAMIVIETLATAPKAVGVAKSSQSGAWTHRLGVKIMSSESLREVGEELGSEHRGGHDGGGHTEVVTSNFRWLSLPVWRTLNKFYRRCVA